MRSVCAKAVRFQRFMSSVSAPNISGTSVRIVVPPRDISKSEKAPRRIGGDTGK